jgi:hypothetical protein
LAVKLEVQEDDRGHSTSKSSTDPGLVVALSLAELFIVLLMLAFVIKPNHGF